MNREGQAAAENAEETTGSELDSDDEDEDDGFEKETENWTGLYSSRQRILLVGEGDFSFSLSLAKSFGSARNIIATSLDKHEDLETKYSKGPENVQELEEIGCLVLHQVDATNMTQHFFLKTQKFDRVVYNFPHVGFRYREGSYCQILLNKRLVKGFLKNAKVLLREGDGEIHVTHKEGEPYSKWDLVRNAEKLGLELYETVPFCNEKYPGYSHKRAHGSLPDNPFPLGDCSTYKFRLSRSRVHRIMEG